MLTPYTLDASKSRQWFTSLVAAVNNTPGNSKSYTFATLPVPVLGQMAVVTDSTTDVWGDVIAGTGGLTVGAFWNGTAWTVMAK